MRKVLSFVLVLALVLSSFSMAFAADTTAAGLTDITGNANEDAIQVNYDLGIVTGNPDGTFLPAKAVNRAEFAAMLTRALDIPDSALAGYTATTFKDTAGYSWAVPYLAFCQSKGILLGDGAGNVMPGRTITVNEAMTMALRAVGYTANSSLLVGAWPSNYVSIAQNNDMYDSVAKTTTVDKANAAQIIYNLLTVQKVSVNSDGTTDLLWVDGDQDNGAQNLLNTNLGCKEDKKVVLGDEYSYEDAIINITKDMGAYGTAYLNDDDELVAFTKDSTALTGSVNDDGDFEVGDVTYEFATDLFPTNTAVFVNTDKSASVTSFADTDALDAWADANSNDGTITLNVDLSGKKIKDVYSVVAWDVTYDDSADALADSDVQDVINDDHELLDGAFVENDDDAIDMNQFELVGVASLDKIAEDNVLYVYTDKDGDIRKVEVGTETVVGTVEEINEDDEALTIGGKEYDLAPADFAAVTVGDFDTDSEGTFYLDINGEIYDFDGTASVDTYGVVKAATYGDVDFDSYKVKLYTSDDATKTLYLSEDNPKDIDWTTPANTATTTITAIVTKGGLIGYSLDSNGDIDAIDNTVKAFNDGDKFKSSKVVAGLSIDSSCVVFTYDGEYHGTTIPDPADYDVAALADIDAGTVIATSTQAGFYIQNEDDDVVAMFISSAFADTESDAIYGVINTRTKTSTDGDPVYKFTGFIDGTAFSYKTSDDTNGNTASAYAYDALNGTKFGVYAFTLDASNQITKIEGLAYNANIDGDSAMVTNGAGNVDDLAKDNTVITVDGVKCTVADDAVVYKYSESDDEYTVSKLSSIDKDDTISLYDTKGDDADGIANVVIYIAN